MIRMLLSNKLCVRSALSSQRNAVLEHFPWTRRFATARAKPLWTKRSRRALSALLVLATSISARQVFVHKLSDNEPSGELVLSTAELEQHRSRESCWVAVNGTVWDVTDFVNSHPGGCQAILDNSGAEIGALFHGIHPAGTLDSVSGTVRHIGRLSNGAQLPSDDTCEQEIARIQEQRKSLGDVDSIIELEDFEAWNYYSSGSDTESSLRNNESAYDRVYFRPRVMRGVRDVDTSASVLGYASTLPIFVSPTARNGLSQELGEVAVTLGSGKGGILQVLSHVASKSLEEVLQARIAGQEVAWQLYVNMDRASAETDILQAVSLGVQSIWLTVDTTISSIQPNVNIRSVRNDPARATPSFTTESSPWTGPPLSSRHDPDITWKDLSWIKSLAPGIPVVVKGIGAWEDALIAKEYGADAVVLSNHGGRQLDYAQAPLETLRDIGLHAEHLIGREDFQIFLDGGVRRGTDVLKAVALGANAVGLGRPFIYAATCWGPEGVEKAIHILRREMEISMRLLGVRDIKELKASHVDISKL